jgi:hypothetical protein
LVAQPADDVASAFEPVNVEVVGRGSAAVWALDSTGQVIGTIATWQDKDGVHIASDYSDGWAETVVHDGEVVSHDATLPSAVLQERAETLASLVASGSGSPEARAPRVTCGLARRPQYWRTVRAPKSRISD